MYLWQIVRGTKGLRDGYANLSVIAPKAAKDIQKLFGMSTPTMPLQVQDAYGKELRFSVHSKAEFPAQSNTGFLYHLYNYLVVDPQRAVKLRAYPLPDNQYDRNFERKYTVEGQEEIRHYLSYVPVEMGREFEDLYFQRKQKLTRMYPETIPLMEALEKGNWKNYKWTDPSKFTGNALKLWTLLKDPKYLNQGLMLYEALEGDAELDAAYQTFILDRMKNWNLTI